MCVQYSTASRLAVYMYSLYCTVFGNVGQGRQNNLVTSGFSSFGCHTGKKVSVSDFKSEIIAVVVTL